ncbi:bifunctional glutamate--cysteine ligase GshA/glutathione synthetase GshB [Clostridium chauvoei]|uniref:bifunctional glutamate--cysteine ligase GshA/glutathione synthetase GshB n=1 Tax=Clostridium chauvoei TaxID=46867 RepID=UPI001C85AE9B|nr:bifunctional glutamate--cysteine ligase GshA/glutathione synthetase GshB [Clostridium chauvoei]MBX7308829.1 bifunctional glutamate--cysteine ligase GshA/glutathione synthetase GshB [Clostridium chauvoei]MBX7354168.1 bifunctional glutamate--cysteine ligase GshA/glutathione synthetase GshB [Clostridium chauvoei]
MLYNIKDKLSKKELLNGGYGLERESLRVDSEGRLSLKPHSKNFHGKMSNPYITTDFSESQVELITPVCNSAEEVYNFCSALFDIVDSEIKDEYLWPQSMPCDIPENHNIPIAEFCKCKEEGRKAREYREKLFKKYGGKKQLISGIHYNFSYSESIIEKLYEKSKKDKSYKDFRDDIYLKVARNYLRYRWLLIYLLGGAAIIHGSYAGECIKKLQKIADDTFSNDGALSYRNGDCGYGNKIELFPDYTNVKSYVGSIKDYVKEEIIDSHKELYSQIRLKARDNNRFLDSLLEDGIKYLEIRSIDINPFDKVGISLEDLKFVNLFTLFLLNEEEVYYEKWQEEALYNQKIVANYGQKNILLKRNGEVIEKDKWAMVILNEIYKLNIDFNLNQEKVIENQIEKVKNPNITYASRITEMARKEGYINANLKLAKEYKNQSYDNRYKLVGYENLELSTQILLKDAIKRGLEIEIIDKNDNFIALKKKNHIEYIKQATKTSVDTYISILMMENKTVTKKILHKNGVKVPLGKEFYSLEEGINSIDKFINKEIVIKPKSTNFGLGVSIFTKGASKEDIIKALTFAFKYDNTVLIEEFIKGKEYRFLVIGDKVEGILHRVPANVLGDGLHSIRDLVFEKNKDSLRGKGYKTPLEKIVLDETVELFLKQRGKTFDYIPHNKEIVYLRENSNISTGGDSIDYTEDVNESFKKIAVDAAKVIGAKICGVDMIIEDYNDENSDYAIIELNFNPAIHIHCFPYKGKERNIGDKILDLLGFEYANEC